MFNAFHQGIDAVHKDLGFLQQGIGHGFIFLHGQNFGLELCKSSLHRIELLQITVLYF